MSGLYKKILVPLDGSELAAQALAHAEEIAHNAGAKLVLLRVLENPLRFLTALPSMGGQGIGVGAGASAMSVVALTRDDAARRQALDDAKQGLDEVAGSLQHRKVETETEIDIGDPASMIVDYAAAHDVDLIVMSTHGRTGIKRWAYGSVANKVLQAAPCAVFVVRPNIN